MSVQRTITLPDDKTENDAEHSFSLALHVWYLSQFFKKLDQIKLIKYALAHDIIEIHAGDILAIRRTESTQKKKDEAEKEALMKLQDEWPDFLDMNTSIKAYLEQSDAEASFVRTVDKLIPVIIDILSEGKFYQEHSITREEIIDMIDAKVHGQNGDLQKIWHEIKQHLLEHDEYFKSFVQ